MNKRDLKKFRKLLETEKTKTLYSDRILRDDFAVDLDDRPDEVDQATTEHEQSMRMRFRNRERLLLKKIDEALARIDNGTFGECELCEEPISKERLMARLTATLCIECKESEERSEDLSAAGLRHKSLGVSISAPGFV